MSSKLKRGTPVIACTVRSQEAKMAAKVVRIESSLKGDWIVCKSTEDGREFKTRRALVTLA